MTTPIAALATAILGTACFACFTWGTITHFVRVETQQAGAWAISLLSMAGYVVFLARLAIWRVSPQWALVWLLFCVSVGLWAWTIRVTSAAPPSLAFTQDAPVTLFARGPYRVIRHPFYTSYLTFWAACIPAGGATPAVVAGLAVFLIMAGAYLTAARHEEGKFARSPLAQTYRNYAAVTGRFLPRPFARQQPQRSS